MVKIEIGNKKGQAALEYLMTYGWAILAVVVVLAVLWYLGIFTPKAPEMCVFDSPFSCIGGTAYVNSTIVKFKVGVQSALVDDAKIIASYTQKPLYDFKDRTISKPWRG